MLTGRGSHRPSSGRLRDTELPPSGWWCECAVPEGRKGVTVSSPLLGRPKTTGPTTEEIAGNAGLFSSWGVQTSVDRRVRPSLFWTVNVPRHPDQGLGIWDTWRRFYISPVAEAGVHFQT